MDTTVDAQHHTILIAQTCVYLQSQSCIVLQHSRSCIHLATTMCAFVSLHVYQFSSRSKDYSYVYSTIRSCSTYIIQIIHGKQPWLVNMPRRLFQTRRFSDWSPLNVFSCRYLNFVSCLFSPHKLNHFLRPISKFAKDLSIEVISTFYKFIWFFIGLF